MKKYRPDFIAGREGKQVLEINPALQPFKLVKYFSYTSFIIILVASFFLSLIISNHAKKVLLDRSESYSELFAENLSRQVFLRFVLPTAIQYGRIALSNRNQFERLDLVVRNVTKGMGIDSVTIYDSNENIISYSTIPELVGKEDKGGIEYRKALRGESNSVLISSTSMFSLLPGAPPVYCKLKTYIPFRSEEKLGGEHEGNIMGVIEVVNDLSDDMEAIIQLQGRILLLSLVIMGILFGVLAYIVFRADRIIEARAVERRQLEVKLHEAERLASLGKMVAAVSHEIKNPLGIVRSTAEVLGKRITKVAPGNEHLAAIIVDETSRLDSIVREFLDFARPKDLKLDMVSLNSLVDRVAAFMKPELENKAVDLVLELDQHLPRTALDPEQVYQVLLNIMLNAIQAMPGGGTMTVRTRSNLRGEIELDVVDTGIGIPADKMEQIFTPFFTDKNRGSGLGLAIAKNIVEKHNGLIAVASSEGKGSTFTLTLGRTKL